MGHVIKTQLIDLTISKSLDAFAVQHSVSQLYWNKLLPIVEKAFDEAAPGDTIIQVDQLEIDLGVLGIDRLGKKEWITDLQITLTNKLQELIRQQSSGKGNVRSVSPTIHIGRQWLYYMQHGYLPWNIGIINNDWHREALQALAGDYDCIQALKQLVKTDNRVVQRIIQHYDENFLAGLLEVLTARKNEDINILADELYLVYRQVQRRTKTTPVLTKDAFRKICRETALLSAAQRTTDFSISDLAEQLLGSLLKSPAIASAIKKSLSGKLSLIQPALEKVSAALQSGSFAKEASTYSIADDFDKKLQTREQPSLKETVAAAMDEDGIFTELAGLVLLHPFLPNLFKQLEWIHEGNFLNKECQQQAILLLHFLATGETIAPEYALVMAKVLCGYPVNEPVDTDFQSSPAIIEVAEHLLQIVIERWEVLKSTTIAGLRESFLQRKGQLQKEEGLLRLQVETGSIDMLLDQLPWGIGMIKLPWMKDLLKVEWR